MPLKLAAPVRRLLVALLPLEGNPRIALLLGLSALRSGVF